MATDQSFEPQVEIRDTSWVHGELATDFDNLARGGVIRVPLDGRYHLTTPDELSLIVEKDILDHRSYRRAKYNSKNFAHAFQSRLTHRWGLNGVGIAIDFANGRCYNVIMYEDGTTEVLDPDADPLVVTGHTDENHPAYTMDYGVLLL